MKENEKLKIPKSIKNKIEKFDQLRIKQNKIYKEVLEWFEKQGIDITEDGFNDEVAVKILYGEFEENDWLNYLLDREKY